LREGSFVVDAVGLVAQGLGAWPLQQVQDAVAAVDGEKTFTSMWMVASGVA
jgi:hypothetical protein